MDDSLETVGEALGKLNHVFNKKYNEYQSEAPENSEASRASNSKIIEKIYKNVLCLETQFRSIIGDPSDKINSTDFDPNSSTEKDSVENEIIDVVGTTENSNGPTAVVTLFDSIINGNVSIETNWDVSLSSSNDEASNVKIAESIRKPNNDAAKKPAEIKTKKSKKRKYVLHDSDSTESDDDIPNNKTKPKPRHSKMMKKSQTTSNKDVERYQSSLHLDGQIILLILKKINDS